MKLIQSNPKNASAVIIYKNNKVLLQKRDNKKNIFYPNYWGLFGGAKNQNENYKLTAIRELNEELNYLICREDIDYFFKMKIEFPIPKKITNVFRYFYIHEIKDIKRFKKNSFLNEGSQMKFFRMGDLKNLDITPYDCFALDLFIDVYLKKNFN